MIAHFTAPDTPLTACHLRNREVLVVFTAPTFGIAFYKSARGNWKPARLSDGMNARSLALARGVPISEIDPRRK